MDKNSTALRHPIINWFINNPVAANLLMLGILIGGLYMVGFLGLFGQTSKLRLEAFPERPVSSISVIAGINGSTPEDIEQGVTNKIEEALTGIQGIEKITSETSTNRAKVTIEASSGYDIDKLYDSVKMQMDTIGNLPAEVEKVTVSKAAWQPSILWVTLHGSANEKTLKEEANRLKQRLLQNPYIEKVNIDGARDAEIQIEISESTLKEYGMTLSQVANIISSESFNLSSGTLETDQGNLSLRIKAQARNKDDFENIIISDSKDGSLVKLGDIAKITDGFVEQNIYVGFNGQPSLTLRLKSGKNANVVEADKAASDAVNDFAKTLPDNIEATIWNNRVSYVKDRINLFIKNSTMGVILVFLLLTLFLNVKLAFWVALGVPISLSGALIAMSVMDISINLITLFGFILVLGIIVDDAIVIGESIYSWKKRTHNAPYSTLKGTANVSVAATFGVLTTVAAFLPLTQINGELGNILGQIGLVVIFCLLFSLVESKLILPSHLSHIHVADSHQQSKNVWEKVQTSVANSLERFIEVIYLPVLNASLRQRYFTLLIFISSLIMVSGLLIGKVVPVSIMPRVGSQSVSLTVEMDSNTAVKQTIALVKKAATALRKADEQLMKENGEIIPNVTHISAFNVNNTMFMVRAGLAGAETRTLSAPLIANRWRKIMGEIAGAQSIDYSARRRWSESDIEVQILGNNEKQLAAGKALVKAIKGIKGIKDVSNNQDETLREILISLKPEAHIYGVTKKQLAQTIRAAFYGQQAQRIQRNNEEIRVMLRYPKSERQSLTDVYKLNVRTHDGSFIPLSALASLSYGRSPRKIEHINGLRASTISANIDKGVTSSDEVMATLTSTILPMIQQEYQVDFTFGGEAEEDEKATKSMQSGFVISLVLIFILLAIPLKSYTRPIIIMTVIPFGVVGAVLGHLFLGMTMSMLSGFGIIALSGVVVNDSLLLLTTIQQYEAKGMKTYEAISTTGVRRFRPVILTSITTFVGLMPMLFETSFQAQFLIPMAVSLGFGILFATSITLILIPVVYAIFDDIKNLFFSKTKNKTNEKVT